MKTTYAKLKSGWGIRTDGEVKPGQHISVTRKDGSVKEEVVKEVVWSGDGVSLCSIMKLGRSGGQTKTCWECGGEFTYADCKANDGDWQDSHCGG